MQKIRLKKIHLWMENLNNDLPYAMAKLPQLNLKKYKQ